MLLYAKNHKFLSDNFGPSHAGRYSDRFRTGGYAINGVAPGSSAADAGLKSGDVITKIDGASVAGFQNNSLGGKTVKFTVTRGTAEIEMTVKIGMCEVTNYHLNEVTSPSPAQMKIREGWLKR